MISHIDSLHVLLTAAAQSAIQVQCVERPASDSSWESILPTIVQTAVSLLSIVAGVSIAVRSFRANRESEHGQWIRDQKKEEWSQILARLAAADIKLPHVFKNTEWGAMGDGVLKDLRNVLPSMRSALFIAESLKESKLTEQYTKFVSDAAGAIQEIDEFTKTIDAFSKEQATAAGNVIWIKAVKSREAKYLGIYEKFHELADAVRQMALRTLAQEP